MHGGFAETLFFKPGNDLLLCLGRWQSGNQPTIDGDAIAGEAVRVDACRRLDNGTNLQVKFHGKLEIARVVRGDGHDGAGAVAHHHVIGDPDRNLLVVNGVDRIAAGEHARLFLFQGGAFQLALARGFSAIGIDRRALCWCGDLVHQRVLGREHHVRCAEERVGARGEHADYFSGVGVSPAVRRTGVSPVCPVERASRLLLLNGPSPARRFSDPKIHRRTFTASDPIALLFLDRFGPIDELQVLEQSLRVGRDLEDPLAERTAIDVLVAFAIAGAVGVDLFIGEDGLASFAPPHRNFGLVGKAFLE